MCCRESWQLWHACIWELKRKRQLSHQAALAVYIHGLCGDMAACEKGTHGMTAKDMLLALPKVLKLSEK